jgi:predicted PurR-regulated permease PerM
MLGLDQKAARATWTAFLVVLLITLTYLARRTILLFLVALFLAYMITPLVDFVSRFMPKRLGRNTSLAIVYVVLVGIVIGLGSAIGSQVAEQGSNLATRLPELVKKQDPLAGLPLPSWLEPVRARIQDTIRTELGNLDQQALPIIRKLGVEILAHAEGILFVVLVPILSFFFLRMGPSSGRRSSRGRQPNGATVFCWMRFSWTCTRS